MQCNLQHMFMALEMAATRHKDQFRKGKSRTPYINHPIQLANILINEGGEEDPILIIGAILHDVVEDTVKNGKEMIELKHQISEAFGEDVLKLVEEVTDDNSLRKEERKRLQVEHAPFISQRAKKLKLADKISNLREIINDPPIFWKKKRIQDYFTWAEEVGKGLRGVNDSLEMALDKCLHDGREKYGR
jgi:GTP diphosphokinase / guanosine-3',5'-bis(diphosphate) 3'-diphosphatase